MSESSTLPPTPDRHLIGCSIVSLGKYGSFPANLILDRPFYLTFEIQDKQHDQESSDLRIVPPSELHSEALTENALATSDAPTPGEAQGDAAKPGGGIIHDQNNRLTFDDPSKQVLSSADIEELKQSASSSGKDIITKILESHTGLGEKTAYSLAKYTLRKTKKYMRRFTVFPLDVSLLCRWMLLEKEPAKILELREETLGLINSWLNVHRSTGSEGQESSEHSSGRWLVVDDTAGLLVASLAERMGILHPRLPGGDEDIDSESQPHSNPDPPATNGSMEPPTSPQEPSLPAPPQSTQSDRSRTRQRTHYSTPLAEANTIHLIHSATQPNLSLLTYFGFDASNPASNPTTHPLESHLKPLSWLQLLHPTLDASYMEPEAVPPEILQTWKSSKKGTYYRKRRRWEQVTSIADETRAGGFDGLLVASQMEQCSVLRHLVPLLRGGAPVVMYSPAAEGLVEVCDAHSIGRKTAFWNAVEAAAEDEGEDARSGMPEAPSEDFPVDPRMLLAPSLQTVRAREWQVLPGRTHPQMNAKGGAEGFVFTATRVLPVGAKPAARGKFAKRKKQDAEGTRDEEKRTGTGEIQQECNEAPDS